MPARVDELTAKHDSLPILTEQTEAKYNTLDDCIHALEVDGATYDEE